MWGLSPWMERERGDREEKRDCRKDNSAIESCRLQPRRKLQHQIKSSMNREDRSKGATTKEMCSVSQAFCLSWRLTPYCTNLLVYLHGDKGQLYSHLQCWPLLDPALSLTSHLDPRSLRRSSWVPIDYWSCLTTSTVKTHYHGKTSEVLLSSNWHGNCGTWPHHLMDRVVGHVRPYSTLMLCLCHCTQLSFPVRCNSRSWVVFTTVCVFGSLQFWWELGGVQQVGSTQTMLEVRLH